jgi:hypothetical protein
MRNVAGIGWALALVATVMLLLGPATPSARSALPGAPASLIFTSDRDGNPELYTMSATGLGQARVTVSAAHDVTPAWDPHIGGAYFFATDEVGNWEIVRIVPGFGTQVVVALPGTDIAPAPEPGSARIVWERRLGPKGELYSMVRAIPPLPAAPYAPSSADDGGPAWSAYAGYKPPGSSLPVSCPLPAPVLAFHSNRGGTYDIWTTGADGAVVKRLTSGPAQDFNPNWSPDCRFVAFERRQNANYDIWVIELATGVERPLLTGAAQQTDPVWSPDRRSLAFVADNEGNAEIYVADVQLIGVGLQVVGIRNLSRSLSSDTAPDWQPILPGITPAGGTPSVPLAPTGGKLTCTKIGSEKADLLEGTAARDVLCGERGADRLIGLRGNDVLIGGPGKDLFRGGRGDDELQAKDGWADDAVAGGPGRDMATIDDPTADRTQDVENVMR